MKLKIFIFIILIFIFSKTQAYAVENSSKSSAFFVTGEKPAEDNRVKILKSYLKQYDSPLVSLAQVFVEEADKNNIDWRLVAAISGLESTFGLTIPPASYNAWGWGIYGNNVTYFTSWDDGIRTVSQGIRERYINQRGAQNVYEIGNTYAASPTWAQRVIGYMDEIENYASLNPTDSLSISL